MRIDRAIGEVEPAWAERDPSDQRAMLTAILAQVSIEAAQGETLDDVLQAIVDCIARQLPVAIASIILLDDEGAHFVQEVCAGMGLDLPADLPWSVHVGAAGRCARLAQAQLIADVEADPDYVSGNPHVLSEYLVPIRHRTRLHGVLNLESTRKDFFSSEVCAVFDAIAVQVAGTVHLARVIGELERANRRLHQLSMSDGLTGVANRRCFDERFAEAWLEHATRKRSLAVLLVDVDYFKALNDSSGHLYGDGCLRELAQACIESVPAHDSLVARYGGDELVILLQDCTLGEATRFGEALRVRVSQIAISHPSSLVGSFVTVSIGAAAVCPESGMSSDDLIAEADHALYLAKMQGRNRVLPTQTASD